MFNLFEKNDDVLCIDVGFRNIKVIEVGKKQNSEIHVKKFALGKTPLGAISNGSIRHVDKVVDVIKRLINEEKIKAKSAKIILSGTNIITQIFLIDKDISKDLHTTIMRAVNYHLPYVGNDYKVEYKILENFRKDNKEMCRVFVTAVPNLVIKSYIEVLQCLNLKALSIDIPSNSTAKLFSKVKRLNKNLNQMENGEGDGNDIVSVIDFGSETTIFNVLENGIIVYNKVILCGSSNIDEHLARELGISLEKAEKLKTIYGLSANEENTSQEQLSVTKSISNYIETYTKKITTTINSYQNVPQGKQIKQVFITGGGSQLKGFNQHLQTVLNVPVQPIYSLDLQGIELDSRIEKEKMIFMTNSLGISI